ncbi:hypothetical protein CY34DRAFT_524588 [Suillus luteus UH-Slu-Lm8-n1]|uniref:Uncharacterized protein n=1 Tax=Suillus luteus UH-Slu-Lm8-n1 TaxID=930992 RepID=A0A0D0BHM1_9AGAM|nr:hypothetical protein CY34DRAFT_524588 [Suillus luteus UH-Slu-Lm8-n1]
MPVFSIVCAERSQISSISEVILQFSLSRSMYSTQKIEEIESIHDDQSFRLPSRLKREWIR